LKKERDQAEGMLVIGEKSCFRQPLRLFVLRCAAMDEQERKQRIFERLKHSAQALALPGASGGRHEDCFPFPNAGPIWALVKLSGQSRSGGGQKSQSRCSQGWVQCRRHHRLKRGM
jgi:hypothetical protein